MRRKLRRWLASFRSSTDYLRWNVAYAWHQVGRFFGYLLRRLRMLRERQAVRYLIQALPVLLVGSAVAVLLFMIFVDPVEQRVAHYKAVGGDAFKAGDLEKAQVIFERLALMDESRPEHRYHLALTVQGQGDKAVAAAQQAAGAKQEELANTHAQQARDLYSRSRAMMAALASPDKQGYPPAHIWWAMYLRRTNSAVGVQVAEIHLRRALQINADDIRANALIGDLYLATGRAKEAEFHFKKAVGGLPELDFALADVYRRLGTKDLAKLHGEKAQRFFRQQAQADVDNHMARMRWAQATSFLEDYAGAVAILQEGLRLSNAAAYRNWLAQAYVAWADSLARNPKTPVAERLALLERAIALDFGNLEALTRLADITRVKDNDAADKARAALRNLLAEGKHPGVVHLLLGMEAQSRDKVDEARQHFEQAYKLSPQTPIVVNNLAWALAHADKPDLEQALNLINTAIQRTPNQLTLLRFLETRGQILAKMGKYDQALPDLEAALRILRGNPGLHKALAETYRKLGNPAMAAEHERLAQAPAPDPLLLPDPETKPNETGKPKPGDGKTPDPKPTNGKAGDPKTGTGEPKLSPNK